MLVSGGIALSAIGGAKLAKPESATNKYSNDRALRKIGSLIIFLTTVLLIIYALYTYRRLKSLPGARSVIRLLHFAMLALPFTYIRAIYSIVYSFDTSPSVNPVTGVFAVKFILIFLVQLLATLFLVVGGIMTRNIRIEDETILSSPGNVRATGSEPRRGGPNEQHIMNEYGVVQGQETKDLASQYCGVR